MFHLNVPDNNDDV